MASNIDSPALTTESKNIEIMPAKKYTNKLSIFRVFLGINFLELITSFRKAISLRRDAKVSSFENRVI